MSITKLFVEAKAVLDEELSLGTLLEQHKKLSRQQRLDDRTLRLLAEVCFLTAREYLMRGERERAKQFAEQSIELYHKIDTSTLESALPILTHALPDFMHEGVVEERILKEL